MVIPLNYPWWSSCSTLSLDILLGSAVKKWTVLEWMTIVIGRPHIISQLLGAISPWLWPPCRTSTGFKLERFKGESPAWKVMVVQNLDRKNWASDLHLRPKKGRKPNRIHPWNDGIFTMRNMWAKHEKMEMSWDNSWKIGRVYQAKCLAVSHEKWRFTISYPLTNPMISM